MINPHKVAEHIPCIAVEFFRHIADHIDGAVAKAYGIYGTVVQCCLSKDAGRVGEIYKPGVGTEPFHIVADVKNDRDRAQCLGKAAGAGGFLPDAAITQGNPFVPYSGVQKSDAKLGCDEVGVF